VSLDLDALQGELNTAIDKVMRKHAAEAFLARYLLVAETVDTEGERGLWLSSTVGMKPWDVLGLTGYAHEQAKADAMGFCTGNTDEDE
jgi:predicted pyridoxine 5'-phosphate oxidase superfamily flavin-nucleotide-binding protein